MDFARRNTRKYSFKSPYLLNLRKLGSLVTSPEDFRARHGNLLSILKTNVEEGILDTLVQFYNPLYHCFKFLDYQLVPNLEEYFYWVGLSLSDEVPFSGLKQIPKPSIIVAALHLEASELQANLTTKGGLQGLPSKFLFLKASTFAEVASPDVFDSTLALLIYGLILFPDIDKFVDINAIQIFRTKNHVPTLLADTYLSTHHPKPVKEHNNIKNNSKEPISSHTLVTTDPKQTLKLSNNTQPSRKPYTNSEAISRKEKG